MKLKLAYYGNPVLRRKADPIAVVDEEIKQLIRDMEETMFSLNGLGLAAPQVHHSVRLFLVNIPVKDSEGEMQPGKTWVFINPKILEVSSEAWTAEEGCLSIPKLYAEVSRPLKVKVEALDGLGISFTQEFEGWEARAVLHENDHINGVLFIDRLHGKKRQAIEPDLQRIKTLYR